MVNQKWVDKAEVLIEALPYIQRFNRKVIVVKYGGSAMTNEARKQEVIEDVVLLKLVGFKPVLVHGGGKEISRWSGRIGLESRFLGGLRVTDADTMELAEMVLAKVNQDLVSRVQSLGVKAAGISGKDGGLLQVRKRHVAGGDLGFVGEVTKVDTKILNDLLKSDYLPIVFPVGMDQDMQTYNINADEAAGAIATSLQAEKLAFLSDVEGVRMDPEDPESVISELYTGEAADLIEEGVITGGMIPKIRNCIDAINKGVTRVHILDGRIPHSLLLEIFTNKGCGTAIIRPNEEKYWKAEA